MDESRQSGDIKELDINRQPVNSWIFKPEATHEQKRFKACDNTVL